MKCNPSQYNKIIYLLQGGGALGAYQVGVCQRLLDEGWQPNWVIGTSIGAINAAIIAGNEPNARSSKLQLFWDMIASSSLKSFFETTDPLMRRCHNFASAEQSLILGQPGFFTPRKVNPWLEYNSTPDKLSFYDTSELKRTLQELIDFDILNHGDVRVSLSSLCLNSGHLEDFDNQSIEITPEHVMASGALPPGFPAIKIGNDYYWDAGISSNTPLMTLLEEDSCEKMLCFMVDLFANYAEEPKNMMEILNRKKDLEFASRYHRMLHYFCRFHQLHSAIAQLCKTYPDLANHPALEGIDTHEPCALSLVRFHYHDKPYDLWSKDFEFSPISIKERREAGYRDVDLALLEANWGMKHGGGMDLHEYPSPLL